MAGRSVLLTERLVLRPFRKDDAEAMFLNWTSDENVARYCRWYAHENISITEKLLKMYIEDAASETRQPMPATKTPSSRWRVYM